MKYREGAPCREWVGCSGKLRQLLMFEFATLWALLFSCDACGRPAFELVTRYDATYG